MQPLGGGNARRPLSPVSAPDDAKAERHRIPERQREQMPPLEHLAPRKAADDDAAFPKKDRRTQAAALREYSTAAASSKWSRRQTSSNYCAIMVHNKVNAQRLLRHGSNPQLDDVRMAAETTQNFSFLQHAPGQRDGQKLSCARRYESGFPPELIPGSDHDKQSVAFDNFRRALTNDFFSRRLGCEAKLALLGYSFPVLF